MVIIKEAKPATQAYNDPTAPTKLCPKCGCQIFKYDTANAFNKEACFSRECAEPVPVAMIRGDTKDFFVKEYGGKTGYYNVTYPKAGEHSKELRDTVERILISWGFTRISFVEPKEGSKERHTVVMAVHNSPLVNVAYRKAPNTQRVFVFDNKFGVVSLQTEFHENDERKYWAWSNAIHAVNKYLEQIGLTGLPSRNKPLVTLSNGASLQKAADDKIKASRKQAYVSRIAGYQDKIWSLQRDIARQDQYINEAKSEYKSEFGEDMPEVKRP